MAATMSWENDRPRATLSHEARRAIGYLRTPLAVRERAETVFAAGLAGELWHFGIDLGQIDAVGERVAAITRERYPDLCIPYHSRWRHFGAGDIDRMASLGAQLDGLDARERGRCLYDLIITSVLLDAGAGPTWSYREADTGLALARSEGLAVASFHMFTQGAFSSHPDLPCRADAEGLERITAASLARHFQVSSDNPLVGVSGRAALLQRLGRALTHHPEIFGLHEQSTGPETLRVGHLFDYLIARGQDGTLPATTVLHTVIDGLGAIWPGRINIGDVNLGDVWRHYAAGGTGFSAGLVPFHKLSQWLAYSLIEPLEDAGVRVTGQDELTGLPEYRNGGLFVDTGVLVPKHDQVIGRAHLPGDEIVVEWRALTIALLDRVAEPVRRALGLDRDSLPLVKVLEGGTWSAGRQIAGELRPDGGPPIRINSDGTVL
jgi:hypothetical protein